MPAPEANGHELVIVGGGPAGYGAALYGASAGLDVALVEMNKVGGTCLHAGCIPAKELLETASVLRAVRSSGEFGIIDVATNPSLDMGDVMARKQRVIDALAAGVDQLLAGRNVTVYPGIGQLGPRREIAVTGADGDHHALAGEAVILATGSTPRTIPGFAFDGTKILSSDDVLVLDHVPSRVAIVGAGAIGCEFASALADFGAAVTLIEALPNILPGCDRDISRLVERAFTRRGIAVKTGVKTMSHGSTPGAATLTTSDGETIEVDHIIMSIGRRPLSDHLGLDGTNVVVDDRGFIVVDEWCHTAEPGVFAIGDVIDTPQLAHVGFAEAILAVKQILGEPALPIDYDNVPWAIYSHPEVAFAGLSEQAAEQAGFDTVVSKHRFSSNGRALILGEPDGMVKVIAESGGEGSAARILGVHMAGPWVTEQLGQGYLAVNWQATVDDIAQLIQPHPTLSELFGESVLALTGRSLHG